MQLGLSYVDAGRTSEAIAAYDRALAVDPLDARVLNNLGAVYNNLRRPESARPLLRRAVAREPRFLEAQMNLGVAEAMAGDLAGAERAFAAALSIQPDHAFARTALEDVRRARAR
jgi:Tfp pilus assembly protein PilF